MSRDTYHCTLGEGSRERGREGERERGGEGKRERGEGGERGKD